MKIKIYKDNYFTGEIVDVYSRTEFISDFIISKTPILRYSAGTSADFINEDTNFEIFNDDNELATALQKFTAEHGEKDFIICYSENGKLLVIEDAGKWLYIAVADALGYGFESHDII